MKHKEAKEKKMTPEEAIKVFESELEWAELNMYPYVSKQKVEADKMAIKALEQEPKTVLYSGDGYADGYMVYDMAECPNCGYEYEEGDKDWGLPFCPNCGQSLNWESGYKE